MAANLAHVYGYQGKSSIASAWTHRAERLLEGREESYVHGYVALVRSDAAKAAGDIDASLELAGQGVQIASRSAHPDLQASALTTLGAGDGFFVAFDGAGPAIACAKSIQQALATHRQGGGIALSVRIGLHTAEASRRGGDYSGIGVHTAARVAALAVDGEILVTADTLADAGDVATAGTREETLKGVTAPVRVVAVPWT